MKWVKVAIGAVIAILSIGIVATSVYGMTQETVRNEVVTFELLTSDTITVDTYDKLYTNLEFTTSEGLPITVDYNGAINNGAYIKMLETNMLEIHFDITLTGEYFYIYPDDTWLQDDPVAFEFNIGDTFEITFEVTQPAQLTGITATLILLTPLIFAGGVLAYLLNKQNY